MKLNIKEVTLFALFGTLMYISKIVMDVFPNIHIVSVLIVAITVVYRYKALYPIYLFVFLTGIFNGFQPWWIPYLYIWTLLWAVVMLLPKKMPKKLQPIVFMSVCALHGFLYGTLYAPVQALLFGLDFKGMITWIIAGLPFDFIHGISNLLCGILIVPIIKLLKRVTNNEIVT